MNVRKEHVCEFGSVNDVRLRFTHGQAPSLIVEQGGAKIVVPGDLAYTFGQQVTDFAIAEGPLLAKSATQGAA